MGRFKKRKPGASGRSKGMGRSIRHEGEESQRPGRAGEPPPAVHLRMMRAEAALEKLAREVALNRRRGVRELLIVHGKGMRSEGGQPVIAPLVRRWIKDHPEAVASWRDAPREWGGEGALVIVLRKAES